MEYTFNKQQIYSLHLKGYSRVEIADRLKLSLNMISQTLLNDFQIPPKRSGRKPKYHLLSESFIEDYKKGLRLTEISKKHRISPQVVSYYLRRNGIVITTKNIVAKPKDCQITYFERLSEFKCYQLGLILAANQNLTHEALSLPLAKSYLFKDLLKSWFFITPNPYFIQQENEIIFNYPQSWFSPWIQSLATLSAHKEKGILHESAFWKGFLSVNTTFTSNGLSIQLKNCPRFIQEALKEFLKDQNLTSEMLLIEEQKLMIRHPKANRQLLAKLPFLEELLMLEEINSYWMKVLCC